MPGNSVPYPNEQIIASLTSGVIALDGTGMIITSNPAAAGHLGVREEQLRVGARLDALEDVDPFIEVISRVMETHEPISRHEVRLPAEDGGTKVIGLSASLLHGPEEFNGAIFLFMNLTELRRLERTAELNRQLAQIGELTAGVVHELRNPLSVVSGMAELLLRKLGPEHDARHPAEIILKEAAHLERSIARFLGFARPFELSPERCRPEDIAQDAHRLCIHQAEKKGVTLTCETGGTLPLITADAKKAGEALANIVANGIEVVPQGGRVTLRTYRDGGEVVFEVTDDGPGIDLEPGEDLFKPFFTKKEGGTGLGLSIVQRIVSAHRGRTTYCNRDEGGARFEIRLGIDL